MRRRILSTLLAIFSVAAFCVCLCLKPINATQPIIDERLETVELVISPAEETAETVKTEASTSDEANNTSEPKRELTAEELTVRFTNMLNLNYCYNANFQSAEMMAVCSAISLNDYADDLYGYGIGVGQHLVVGFAENFYGVTLNFEEIELENSVNGYVLMPQYSIGTQNHRIISITPTDDGYEVVSEVEFYYGGNDVEISFASSVFKTASSSEFGFILAACELM